MFKHLQILQEEHSFTSSYSKLSRVLLIFVFLDYILRQTLLKSSISDFSFYASLIINSVYFALFLIFFGIIFYRFYKCIFQKNIIYACFKRREPRRLMVSSHELTLKHKANNNNNAVEHWM